MGWNRSLASVFRSFGGPDMRSWRDKFRALGLEGLGSKVWGAGGGG